MVNQSIPGTQPGLCSAGEHSLPPLNPVISDYQETEEDGTAMTSNRQKSGMLLNTHPTLHRQPPQQSYTTPNVNSAEVERP